MSILTGREIMLHVQTGAIGIDPYKEENIGPNSYNLTLSPVLKVYEEVVLDCKHDNRIRRIEIPTEGYILQPGTLYLGKTQEFTRTDKHVPMIEGRSSFARLGMAIHVTGGFGDLGFQGNWTLEIIVIHPLRVYPYMKVCQIFYHEPIGPTDITYDGKYQGDRDVRSSQIHTELNPQEE